MLVIAQIQEDADILTTMSLGLDWKVSVHGPNPISNYNLYPFVFDSPPLPLKTKLQGVVVEISLLSDGIQEPRTLSAAVNIVYSRRDQTSSAVVIYLFFKPDFITVPFAIYLMEIEKHRRSQFVHNFKLSIMSSIKNEHCLITCPLAVL